jgi:hypothetical protein
VLTDAAAPDSSARSPDRRSSAGRSGGRSGAASALRRLPAVLRLAVLALIVLALAVPTLWSPHGAASHILRLRSDADLRDPVALLAGPRPAALTYEAGTPPSPAALAMLAAAAGRAPLYAAAPGGVRLVDASVTAHPLAGRAAAVSFRVRGPAKDTARVYLTEAGAPTDSLSVAVDPRGEATGAFRVRPASPGWREWSVRAVWPRGDSVTAMVGAWVDSAGPPRVLVRAGFPDWESKFVTRALEESGARVDEGLSLGRGLAVAEGAGSAITPARLAQTDAVIVLDGAPLSAGEAASLAAWASAGGGVLLAGDRAATPGFGLTRGADVAATIDGGAIRWAAPPEIAPLPADRVVASGQPLGAAVAGSALVATAPTGGVLALRPLGDGRAAALAITETWRWRMEAGRVAEHREFWRSLVDWLSSARPRPLAIDLPRSTGIAGERQEVRVYDRRAEANAPAPAVVVTRPGGGADTLRLVRDPSSAATWRGSFVAAAPGLHTFAIAGEPPIAGFRAVATPPASDDAWARLSLIASRSGGRMVPADSMRPLLARLAPARAPRGPSATLVFVALLVLATAEWAIRRLTGRA